MKKVIVTTCVAVLAAVAAQAQGLGTVRDINGFGQEYLPSKKASAAAKRKQNNAENVLAQAVKEIERKGLEEAKKAQATASAQAPAQNNNNTAVKADKAADKKSEQNKTANKKEGSWWKALFGGRYPGESDEQYQDRLAMRTLPAAQPFK